MRLIPAIDIRGGRCVRLRMGDFADETVFGDDPVVMAEAFASLTSAFVMYRTVMGLMDSPSDALAGTSVEQLVDLFFNGAAAR